jgi:hypothetical protein
VDEPRRQTVVTKQGKRPLAEVLREVPGQWVAIDRLTNEPQAVSGSPDTLMAEIRTRRLVNIGIVRAPDPSEPELVGLG